MVSDDCIGDLVTLLRDKKLVVRSEAALGLLSLGDGVLERYLSNGSKHSEVQNIESSKSDVGVSDNISESYCQTLQCSTSGSTAIGESQENFSDDKRQKFVSNLLHILREPEIQAGPFLLVFATAIPELSHTMNSMKLCSMIIDIIFESFREYRKAEEEILSNYLRFYKYSFVSLANLSRYKHIRNQILDNDPNNSSFVHLRFLWDFLLQDRDLESVEALGIQHLMGLFANLALDPEGRRYILQGDLRPINILCKMYIANANVRSHLFQFLMNVSRDIALDFKMLKQMDGTDNLISYVCCCLYPPMDSLERLSVMKNPLGEFDHTERPINEFVNLNAFGLITSLRERTMAFNIFHLYLSSPDGRELLRNNHVYEVLRLWHILETSDKIKQRIEDVVHLLVYSEEELEEQNKSTSLNKIESCI